MNKIILLFLGLLTSSILITSAYSQECFVLNNKYVLSSGTEVKCCPSVCAGDEWCDYEYGCRKQCNTLACGEGYCCKQMDSCANGYRYTAKSCSDGLKCCYDLGSTERGICRTECFNVCNDNGVCDTDIGETSENCGDCRTNSIGSSSATTTVIIVMIIGLFVFGSYKIVKSVIHSKKMVKR